MVVFDVSSATWKVSGNSVSAFHASALQSSAANKPRSPAPPCLQEVLLVVDWEEFKLKSTLTSVVSHAPQITGLVPDLDPGSPCNSTLMAPARPSKDPIIVTALVSNWLVSIHTSAVGLSAKVPCQNLTKKGVTFSDLVAKGCVNHSCSE